MPPSPLFLLAFLVTALYSLNEVEAVTPKMEALKMEDKSTQSNAAGEASTPTKEDKSTQSNMEGEASGNSATNPEAGDSATTPKVVDSAMSPKREERYLFEFKKYHDLDCWKEVSDTVREVGMSKAVFALQSTQVFQRAVFFTLLNPQPNGAGFAGIRTNTQFNITGYQTIQMRARGQGQNSRYKICLRHQGFDAEGDPSYEQIFKVPMGHFDVVSLAISDFKPFFRGRPVPPDDAPSLDTSNITTFEFQMFGGVYLPDDEKQAGASALEIEWVKVL